MERLELQVAWQQHIAGSPNVQPNTADQPDQWFFRVLARYREPLRRYHGVDHLRWVVRHVRSIGTEVELPTVDLDAAIAAAFFHDVVYDPTHADNEASSASLALEALDDLGWSSAARELVASMILATRDHLSGASLATATLLAADLGVLASEPASYAQYARQVRAEYRHVPDDQWVTGRGAVLRSFLERTHIFDPALRLDEWEIRARANLSAEMSTLK